MMDFYMAPGSCSTGIHILLEELDLLFSVHVVNLPAGDQFKPDFVAINPKSTIPVLVRDDGSALTEFTAIAWWLAASHPKANLLPSGIDRQAEVLDVMGHIVGGIHGQGFARIFTPDRFALRAEDTPAVQERGREIVTSGFAVLAPRLEAGGGYLFEHFSIADAALFYVEFWADRTGHPLPDPCRRHFELMSARPVVRRVLQEEGYRV